MSFIKKFKINGLNRKARLDDVSKLVLDHRIRRLLKDIDKYFKDDSTKNLHRMRITFRRFRYILEIFYECIPSRIYKHVYCSAKELHDLIGTARDLDVMKLKMQTTAKEIKQEVPIYFIDKFEKEKLTARQNIKLELIKFISDKDINKLII